MTFKEIKSYCKDASDPIIYRESWKTKKIDGKTCVKVIHMLEYNNTFECFYQNINDTTDIVKLIPNYKFTAEDMSANDWDYAM